MEAGGNFPVVPEPRGQSQGESRLSGEQPLSLKEQAANLPLSPGVYLHKDKTGKIIYVGKAKSLKNRVSSYFANLSKRDRKTERLIAQIRSFDYIVTPTELDAFVLETSLIKQHRPKYNILLKDARGFNYVRITRGDYPRMSYTLNADDSDCDYMGPYVGGFFVKQSVEDANRIFMLPSCNRKFGAGKPERACLNYRIKRCMGVCRGTISPQEYREVFDAALDYIKNGSKASVETLTAEMNAAAEALEFEKAARLRDRIAAMKRTATVQSVISAKTTDYDVIGAAFSAEKAAIAVVKYSGGRLVNKEAFYLGDEYSHAAMLADFLREYYADGAVIPPEIYLDTELDEPQLMQDYLSGLRESAGAGGKCRFAVPKRGEGLAQVTLAKSNAAEELAVRVGRQTKEAAVLSDLSKLLGLAEPPEYIACFDISNIGESVRVGARVVFRNGRPYKKEYRRYNIKQVDGLDDYACMREVVGRSFGGGDDFTPDLIFVDGGSGHVSAVADIVGGIPLFGLVKDSKHKTRAVAAQGGEIEVQANKSVFALLTKIQDEVHRFAVTFAREKHKKSSFALSLTDVPGIGEAKAAELLREFRTKTALKAATAEELRGVAKISAEKAEELRLYIERNL